MLPQRFCLFGIAKILDFFFFFDKCYPYSRFSSSVFMLFLVY
jgi:hypothetical protein